MLTMVYKVVGNATIKTMDSYKCHANNVNQMRKHFNRILWDMYNSTWLSDMYHQLTGKILPVYPHSEAVADLILENEYPLN